MSGVIKHHGYKWKKNLTHVSVSDDIKEVEKEWDVKGSIVGIRRCICSAKIKNLILIKNNQNGKCIAIGSACMRKLNNKFSTKNIKTYNIKDFEKIEYDEINLEVYLNECASIADMMDVIDVEEEIKHDEEQIEEKNQLEDDYKKKQYLEKQLKEQQLKEQQLKEKHYMENQIKENQFKEKSERLLNEKLLHLDKQLKDEQKKQLKEEVKFKMAQSCITNRKTDDSGIPLLGYILINGEKKFGYLPKDNMIPIEMKFCRECDKEIPKTDFYKTIGESVQTLCKVHTNKKRLKHYKDNHKPKKVLGFLALDENIRKQILEDVNINKMKIRPIAQKYKIKYPTLLNWKKTGQLV